MNNPRDHQKTAASEVEDRVYLDIWEELVGELQEFRVEDQKVVLSLCCGSLVYPRGSDESGIMREALDGVDSGLVKVVRTDIDEKPVIVANEALD